MPATAAAAAAADAQVCTFANKRQRSSSEMHARETFAQVISLFSLKDYSNSTKLAEPFISIKNLSSLKLNCLLCARECNVKLKISTLCAAESTEARGDELNENAKIQLHCNVVLHTDCEIRNYLLGRVAFEFCTTSCIKTSGVALYRLV